MIIIIEGIDRVGKTTLAKIFARAINCQNPDDGNPCNECDICKGTGAKPGTSPQTCTKCGGKGQVVFTQQSFLGTIRNVQTCPECNGSGKTVKENRILFALSARYFKVLKKKA